MGDGALLASSQLISDVVRVVTEVSEESPWLNSGGGGGGGGSGGGGRRSLVRAQARGRRGPGGNGAGGAWAGPGARAGRG